MNIVIKILFPLLLWLLSIHAIWGSSLYDINGVSKQADTLKHRVMGPGATYTFLRFPEYPLEVHLMTIDLDNPHNAVETFQAQDQAGKTERMTNTYHRLSLPGHRTIGSINGNFWIVSGQGQPSELLGVPHSGSVRNGEMITDPNGWNRGRWTTQEERLNEIGVVALDENRKLWIDDMSFDGKAMIDGVGEYPISQINRIRGENELVFFNHYAGTTTRSDNNGTEVFIKPIESQTWAVNKLITCRVVRVEKGKGNNIIQEGESVLSGTGLAQIFLDNLSPGMEVKVNMGIYTSQDLLRPLVRELITGNALVMKNGELTIRNTNETYNSQLYPRTGVGMSADGKKLFLIVIDGKGKSVGANTATMSGILKTAGAYNVSSLDGGGSAQMMINGAIVNYPADGTERAVANGWMLFSTAPDDETISRIDFADYNLTIPANAYYKPTFLGYNPYDLLCNENLKGVTLTCDPALGKIVNDTIFIASATPQTGSLIAHYNGIEYRKKLTIVESTVALRLDSVLLDNQIRYPVEVEARSGGLLFYIDPGLINWSVDDPDICRIENGILQGLANGITNIRGQFNDIALKQKVKVEIPATPVIPVDQLHDFSTWTIKSTSNIQNPVLTSTTLPTSIRYTYTSGRSPFVQLYRIFPLYSIPDSVKIVLNTQQTGVLSASVTVKANYAINYTPLQFTGIVKGEDYTLKLPMSMLLDDVNNRAAYPVYFEGLKLMLDASAQTVNQEYEILVKEFVLVYGNMSVGVDDPQILSRLKVYPNPVVNGEVRVALQTSDSSVHMELLTIQGQKIYMETKGIDSNGEVSFSLRGIPSGIYLMKLYHGGKVDTVKLIIK